MELKRVFTLAIFALLLAIGFVVYFFVYLQNSITSFAIKNGRDMHGCLVRSGFNWDNSTQACTKEDSNETIIFQVINFETCRDAGYAISESNKTKKLQCQTLNGTSFMDNSTKNLNLSEESNTTEYPDDVIITGNFSIADLFK